MATEKFQKINKETDPRLNSLAEDIKADIVKLGLVSPTYNSLESVDELRAYFRMCLEPLLRFYKSSGKIKNFLIGISPAFFYHPKLRVFLTDKKYFEISLAGIYKIYSPFGSMNLRAK